MELLRNDRMDVPRTSLASVESLSLPLVQEVVLSLDFQCKDCRNRIADVISKINGETESIVVSVLDKKITIMCKYPTRNVPTTKMARPSPIVAMCKKPLNKVMMIKRLFHFN